MILWEDEWNLDSGADLLIIMVCRTIIIGHPD